MTESGPPPTGEPPFSPVLALVTIARTWDAELAATLRELGLTTRTYALLGHIRATPGISFSELARRSRITVQSAHTAVARLLQDGLVADATAQAGARSVLEVTPHGSELLSRAAANLRILDERLAVTAPGLAAALRAEIRRAVREGGTFS
jgi:DNA-binding MarR family transcriptional regulator